MTETGKRVWDSLTKREKEFVIVFVDKASTNKVLAQHFGTTEQVIKNRLRFIFDKTGMSNRMELFKFLLANGVHAE